MRRIGLLRTFFLALLVISREGVAQEAISLAQAQSQALSSNLELRSMEQGFEAVKARRNRGKSAFYPKLGIETGFERYSIPGTSREGHYLHGFLEYSLFNGGRDYFGLRALSTEEQQAQIRLEKGTLELSWNVERTFYQTIYLQEVLRGYEEAITRNRQQLKWAADRRKAGLVSVADVYEFEIYGSILDSEKTIHESELLEVQNDLRKLLGLQSEAPLKLNGKLSHYHLKETLSELVARIPTENQSILLTEREVERSEALKRSAWGSLLPSFNLRVTQGQREIDEPTNETAIWAVARWELFSGFDSYWGLKEARATLAQSESNLQHAQLSARTDLNKTFSALDASQKRVDLEAKNKERSLKYFDSVTAEYRRGVKNSPDLRGASEQLLEAYLRDLKYRYEFFARKIELQKIVGGNVKTVLGSQDGHID